MRLIIATMQTVRAKQQRCIVTINTAGWNKVTRLAHGLSEVVIF